MVSEDVDRFKTQRTKLLIRVATVIVLGCLDGSLVALDWDFGLAGTALVVVVDSVAGGDIAGAHIGMCMNVGWENWALLCVGSYTVIVVGRM